jgi:flagellar protein FlgJ
MNPVPSISAAAARPVALEDLARQPQAEDPARRAEAARQFEAMLVRQILSEAQKPVFRSSMVKDSTASAIYRDQLTAQLAEAVTQGGGLGLARALMEQWQTTPAPAESRPLKHEGAS